MSEIEKAMTVQPALLDLEWTKRIPREAAQAVRKAKKLVFVGMGSSFHAALWAHWLCQLESKGKIESQAITTWDLLALPALPSPAAFIVISHRGNRGMTKELLKRLGRAPRVLIAGETAPAGSSPVVFTSPQETSNAHSMSLIGAMCAASELIALRLEKAAAARLRKQRRATAGLLDALQGQAAGWQPGFSQLARAGHAAAKPGVHFIGGGPFQAVALELRLKAQEIAHLPSHAYNIEQFLHGPIAALEEHDFVTLLPPLGTPKGRAGRLLFGDRLERCRAAAEAIGTLVVTPRWDAKTIRQASVLGLSWQSLLSLYWGQTLCVTYAKAKGLDPDSNRREDPRYDEARRRIER